MRLSAEETKRLSALTDASPRASMPADAVPSGSGAQAAAHEGGGEPSGGEHSGEHRGEHRGDAAEPRGQASYRYDGLECDGQLRLTGDQLRLTSQRRHISVVLYRRHAPPAADVDAAAQPAMEGASAAERSEGRASVPAVPDGTAADSNAGGVRRQRQAKSERGRGSKRQRRRQEQEEQLPPTAQPQRPLAAEETTRKRKRKQARAQLLAPLEAQPQPRPRVRASSQLQQETTADAAGAAGAIPGVLLTSADDASEKRRRKKQRKAQRDGQLGVPGGMLAAVWTEAGATELDVCESGAETVGLVRPQSPLQADSDVAGAKRKRKKKKKKKKKTRTASA